MTINESTKISRKAVKAGLTVIGYRRYGNNSYSVDCVDPSTGYAITFSTVEEWEDHKEARDFEAKYMAD